MTRPPFRALIASLERSCRFMAVSNKALVPSLILVNVRGSLRGRLDAPVPIKWTTAIIKVLVVYLGNGNLEEENWRSRINAVEKCLNSRRGRSRSYSGKALIVNALALSRVWYTASLISMPDWVASKLNTLVFFFLLERQT